MGTPGRTTAIFPLGRGGSCGRVLGEALVEGLGSRVGLPLLQILLDSLIGLLVHHLVVLRPVVPRSHSVPTLLLSSYLTLHHQIISSFALI